MKKIYLCILLPLLAASVCAGATLTGRVLDPRGNPVPALKLVFVQQGTGRRITVTANESGSFTQLLTEGEYAIHPAKSEGKTPLATLWLDADQEKRLLIRVGEGGELHITESQLASTAPAEEDPSLVPIREYQVQTHPDSSATAEELRQMAQVVNPFPAQKRGRFHGSLYEFHRNDNFDARNFFDPVGKPLPEYKRNQFGLTLGLALGANLNILGTYEGLRITQGSTLLSHLPTSQMKHGDFGDLPITLRDPITKDPFPGNQIPESRIHPAAKGLLKLLPDPNRPDPDRNFVNNKPIVRDRNSLSLRGDYQMKSGSSFLASCGMSNGNDFYVHALPAFGSTHEGRNKYLMLSYNQKINRRLLAGWRVEAERSVDFTGSVNAGKPSLLASVGIPGLAAIDSGDEGYPDFRLSGYSSFGDAGLPYASTNNRFTLDGSLTFTPQRHTFRLGGGLTGNQSNNNRSDGIRRGRFSFNGYYSGDAFADFLLGVPDSATRGRGSERADLRRKTWYLFARDEWKFSPRFSFSWGVTYNYFQPFHSIRNNVAIFHPLVFEPPIEGEIIIAGSPRSEQLGFGPAGSGGMLLPDRSDWAPSLGLAYRPLGGNRLIARSSYSVYYAPLGRESFVSYLGRNYPFYYLESALSPTDKAEITFDAPFAAVAPTELSIRGIEPRLRTAYISNWAFSLQAELFRQWHLQGSYNGSKGTHMVRTMVANVPLPGAGSVQSRRPNPNYGRFTILTGSGSYSRNAVDLDAERRLADGISMRTGFSLTEGMSDLYGGYPSNPRNLRAERARFDAPARQFYLTYIMDLPFGKNGRFGRGLGGWVQPLIGGWRLSGITRFQDGTRFTVISQGDPNNDGVSDDHPDRLGPGSLEGSERTIDNWFAVSDFAAPGPYSYGNSGRNILTGPPYVNWDLSVIKQTRISDGNLLEFRLEFFNAFNQVNFEQPSAAFGTSLFGKVFGAHRAREIEVALRYSF